MRLIDADALFKCLDGNHSCHGGRGSWTPMRWRSIKGKPVACERGIHYCRGAQVMEWLSPDLWLFEDGGDEHDDRDDKCVTNRGRITEHIDTWNEETARLFAVDCTRLAVNRYAGKESELLHACLDVAAGVALGYTDDAARAAAWAAAWDAARAAAWAAAWDAARAAARAAAWDAARAAARAAAGDAAGDAAWAAASAAAWAAAAARDAASAAARTDQYALLCRYLNGEQGPFVEEDA